MKSSAFFVALYLLGSQAALASQEVSSSLAPCVGDTYEKSTPQFLDDPYYPGAKMRAGKYKGQCIDTSWQRPARILTREESVSAGVPAGYLAIANFSHGGRFWIAQLPVGGVENVIFQMEHFSFSTPPGMPTVGIPSAHTEIRFKFRPGSEVILIPQSNEAREAGQAREVRISDIVYSVELIAPKGVGNFDFINGMKGNFASVYRFCSLEDKAKYMVTDQSHRVEQFLMKLDDRQKQKLLLHSVVTSYNEGLNGIYNTAFKNCTSEAFRLFDEALVDDPGYKKGKFLNSVIANIPSQSRYSLRVRGLLDPVSWPDLNDEMKSLR